MYTRVRFNWNELKYSVYATYELFINIIGKYIKKKKIASEIKKINNKLLHYRSYIRRLRSQQTIENFGRNNRSNVDD